MWTPDASIIITSQQRQAEAEAALVERYRLAIQAHVDEIARDRRYDSGFALASYVASTNPAWAAEAVAFVAWRDSVWLYAYTELDNVQAGHRPAPSVEEFLGELPAIEWPSGAA